MCSQGKESNLVMDRINEKFIAVFISLAVLLVTAVFISQSNPTPIFTDSISRHIDCIQGSYPMEIFTEDTGEIRQWFEGKMYFAVRLPELSGTDLKPVGARICHLNGRRVAYVTYQRNGHTVSMFTLDMDGVKIPRSRKIKLIDHTFFMKTERGHTSILCLDWRIPGMATIWVSDISATEMIKWAIS